MSKLTGQLRDPNTNFMRPASTVRPVDYSGAAESLFKAGVMLDKSIQTEDLKEELSAITGTAVAAEQEAQEISSEEIVATDAVGRFTQKVDRLQRAIASGVKEDAVVARAQAELKAAIDKRPAYAAELRAAYANSFGMSTARLKGISEMQKDRVKELQALKDDYIAKGGILALWGTPEGTKDYMEKVNLASEKQKQADRLSIAQDTKNLAALNSEKEISVATNSYISDVDGFLAKTLITTADGQQKQITALTDEDVINLSSEERNKIYLEIPVLESQIRADAVEKFGELFDATQIESIVKPSLDFLTSLEGFLDSPKAYARSNNQFKYMQDAADKKLLGTPEGQLMSVLGRNNIPISDVAKLGNQVALGKVILGSFVNPAEIGDPSSLFSRFLNSLEDSEVPEEQKQGAIAFAENMLKFTDASFDMITERQQYDVMRWASNPDFKKLAAIAGLTTDQTNKLVTRAQQYFFDTANHLATELGQAAQGRVGIPLGGTDRPAADLVRIEKTPAGLLSIKAIDNTQAASLAATRFDQTYIKRFNAALKAAANLSDESVDSVLDAYLKQSDLRILKQALNDEEDDG